MLEWLDSNWEDIKEFYKDTFVYNVKKMILPYPETANSMEQLDKINSFLKKHRAELGGQFTVQGILEKYILKIMRLIPWKILISLNKSTNLLIYVAGR